MNETVACSCCTYVRYTCLQHAFQGLLNSSLITVASISSFNDKEVNADLFDSIFTVLTGYIPNQLGHLLHVLMANSYGKKEIIY